MTENEIVRIEWLQSIKDELHGLGGDGRRGVLLGGDSRLGERDLDVKSRMNIILYKSICYVAISVSLYAKQMS